MAGNMNRRQSVAYRDGVVTRILADQNPDAIVYEDIPDQSKCLSADWMKVLSTKRAQTMAQLGLQQLLNYADPQEHHEERPPVHFCTGSTYTGQWNNIGMSGFGTYRMPHDVEYEGELRDGVFHGDGTLVYSNGCKLFGHWEAGRMIKRRFQYTDGLQYAEHNWRYCEMPDRRFRAEHVDGLKPAGRTLKAQQVPPRTIPSGCYDTGDGFYSPVTKCVTDPKTGKVLRIPGVAEEEWIKKHCRRAWDENCGFRPDLYENWFDPHFIDMSDTSLETDHELLSTVGHVRTSDDDLEAPSDDSDFELISSDTSFDPNLSRIELLDVIGEHALQMNNNKHNTMTGDNLRKNS